jgi:hypothetical protein
VNSALAADNARIAIVSGNAGTATLEFGDNNAVVASLDWSNVLGIFTFSSGVLLPSSDPVGFPNLASREGIGKAYAYCEANAAINGSFNVSSVTKEATGEYQVNWDRDFANTNYTAVACPDSFATRAATVNEKLVGSTDVQTITTTTGNDTDTAFNIIAFGDQ